MFATREMPSVMHVKRRQRSHLAEDRGAFWGEILFELELRVLLA